MDVSDRRAATAHHEAGHAVAHFVLRRRIDRVTIVEDDESFGRVSGQVVPENLDFLEYGPATLRELKAVEDAIVAGLAGAVAECRYTGKPKSPGARDDVAQVFSLAEAVCSSPRTTQAYVDYLSVVAEEMIEANRNLVEALAAELLERETLSGPATRRVLKDAVLRSMDEPRQALSRPRGRQAKQLGLQFGLQRPVRRRRKPHSQAAQ